MKVRSSLMIAATCAIVTLAAGWAARALGRVDIGSTLAQVGDAVALSERDLPPAATYSRTPWELLSARAR